MGVYDRGDTWHDIEMALAPDHLVICVDDLDEAEQRFVSEHGLSSLVGGRHPGHGTANRIIPLGDSYIELVAVVDASEAAESSFGSWVLSEASDPPRVNALCLRTDDISLLASDRDIEPVAMSRARPDGSTLSWKLAGIERTISDGYPFFVEWEVEDHELPGRTAIDHPAGPTRLESVEVVGDKEHLESWISGADKVVVSSGPQSISAMIESSHGLIRL